MTQHPLETLEVTHRAPFGQGRAGQKILKCFHGNEIGKRVAEHALVIAEWNLTSNPTSPAQADQGTPEGCRAY